MELENNIFYTKYNLDSFYIINKIGSEWFISDYKNAEPGKCLWDERCMLNNFENGSWISINQQVIYELW